MKKVVSFLKKNQKMILMLLAIIVVVYFVLPMVMEPFVSKNTEPDQKEEEVKGNDIVDINESQPAVVLFHSESCPHCVKMMPEWEKAKEQLKKDVQVIEKEGADISKEESELHEIAGYPTIKYCPKGLNKPSIEHDGDRTAESIVEFVKKQQ